MRGWRRPRASPHDCERRWVIDGVGLEDDMRRAALRGCGLRRAQQLGPGCQTRADLGRVRCPSGAGAEACRRSRRGRWAGGEPVAERVWPTWTTVLSAPRRRHSRPSTEPPGLHKLAGATRVHLSARGGRGAGGARWMVNGKQKAGGPFKHEKFAILRLGQSTRLTLGI